MTTTITRPRPYKAGPYLLRNAVPDGDGAVWYYLSNSGKVADFHLDTELRHISFQVRFPKAVR